jgi:hypothetical protein
VMANTLKNLLWMRRVLVPFAAKNRTRVWWSPLTWKGPPSNRAGRVRPSTNLEDRAGPTQTRQDTTGTWKNHRGGHPGTNQHACSKTAFFWPDQYRHLYNHKPHTDTASALVCARLVTFVTAFVAACNLLNMLVRASTSQPIKQAYRRTGKYTALL